MYYPIATKLEAADCSKAVATPVHLNDRYRPRDIGIGYGKSSGYASTRKYISSCSNSLVRVR